MINKVKQATNTNRSASEAQNRKEELKVTRFFKKDQSSMLKTKIAKDANEGIKYLNKRKPLAPKDSDKDLLFPTSTDEQPQQQ